MLLNNRKNINGKKLIKKERCKTEEEVSPNTTPTITPDSSKDFMKYDVKNFIRNYFLEERLNSQYMDIEIPSKAPIIVSQG